MINLFKKILENNHINFKVTSQMDKQINLFYKLLIDKNKVMNLTRITTKEDFIIKHVYDSFFPYFNLKTNKETIIDIGSGAGFPGIILKIFFPKTFIILVESITKKANFLKEVITMLKLENIIVLNKRSEAITYNDIQNKKIDIVTNRAVASLSKIINFIPKVINKSSLIICYKGPKSDLEINDFFKINSKFQVISHDSYLLPNNIGERSLVSLKLKV